MPNPTHHTRRAQTKKACPTSTEFVCVRLCSSVFVLLRPSWYVGHVHLTATTAEGRRWVASWQTVIGDVEEVVNVVEFESIDAYHSAKVSLLASPEWKQLNSELRPLVKSGKQLLLSATQYSPLR